MVRLWGGKQERPLDPAFAESGAYEVPIDPSDLTWQLDTPGLTTQYKSFYFTFEGNKGAGYIQYAYGNLGALVRVCPMGFTYYGPGEEPIVASHTLRASQMKVSKDRYSTTIGPHSVIMDENCKGWTTVIVDNQLSYNLHFLIESEAFVVHDFGRDTPVEQLRHKVVPKCSVTGTVVARGQELQVKGYGSYIEAFFMHVKFTDCCNRFVNFQLRSEDSNEVLTLLQYSPRNGGNDLAIGQGSYTKDGKVVSINFESSAAFTGQVKHKDSGYDLPSDCLYSWTGKTTDGRNFKATSHVKFTDPSSITDVLSIFPDFFKSIVKIWAGLPFVFCYRVSSTTASIEIDGVKSGLSGTSSTELTIVR